MWRITMSAASVARRRLLLIMLFAVAACGSEGENGQMEAGAPAQGGEGDAPVMEEPMPGAGAAMESAAMVAEMRARLPALEAAGGDEMPAMVPDHGRRLSDMISRMEREMSQAGVRGDAAWAAVVDSLRQDVARMPEMDAPELEVMMEAHVERVRHLMEMHERVIPGGAPGP